MVMGVPLDELSRSSAASRFPIESNSPTSLPSARTQRGILKSDSLKPPIRWDEFLGGLKQYHSVQVAERQQRPRQRSRLLSSLSDVAGADRPAAAATPVSHPSSVRGKRSLRPVS